MLLEKLLIIALIVGRQKSQGFHRGVDHLTSVLIRYDFGCLHVATSRMWHGLQRPVKDVIVGLPAAGGGRRSPYQRGRKRLKALMGMLQTSMLLLMMMTLKGESCLTESPWVAFDAVVAVAVKSVPVATVLGIGIVATAGFVGGGSPQRFVGSSPQVGGSRRREMVDATTAPAITHAAVENVAVARPTAHAKMVEGSSLMA